LSQLSDAPGDAWFDGTHLASVAAENEPQAERAREFSDLSSRLKLLYEQVITRLRTNK
jgi:hypothetical protein